MSKRDLVITAGNGDYFDDLQRFVDSLLGAGEYDGRVVVCDNVITGTWNNPGTYLEEPGFSDDQYAYFRDMGVEVVRLHELIGRNGVTREEVESIVGRTQRYPYKFIYNCLISKEYRRLVDRVCYLDSDVVVQRPVRELFDQVGPAGVYMTPEHQAIGDMATMRQWVGTTDVTFGGSASDFDEVMSASMNLCTGFIAGGVGPFNRFMQLCWVVAASDRVAFHTDQPLVNILSHYYGFPVVQLGRDVVLHLKGAPPDRLSFEGGAVLFDGTPPVAVHFNGTSDREVREGVRVGRLERAGRGRRLDYLVRRAGHRVSRLADSRAVRAVVDVDVRDALRRAARRTLPERVRASLRGAIHALRR